MKISELETIYAFPIQIVDEGNGTNSVTSLGMTLRDYFAGQALAAIAGTEGLSDRTAAIYSYDIADAMMEARQK